MNNFPRISIITPSYNQGKFLEETILSVIGQNYPNLEYIIIDGGSSDNSVEIIKKFEKYLSYGVSEKDNGQSEAINKGFAKTTGDILGWLNSDDYYLPGSLHHIASQLNTNSSEIICGNCFHFHDNTPISWGSDIRNDHGKYNLLLFDYITQPSTFWTRKLWEKNGPLNNQYRFVFDWEYFIKARTSLASFLITDKYLSAYRFHESHKSGIGGKERYDEIIDIYRKYSGDDTATLGLSITKYMEAIPQTKKKIRRMFLQKFETFLIKKRYREIYDHDKSIILNMRKMLGAGDQLY